MEPFPMTELVFVFVLCMVMPFVVVISDIRRGSK